ncbi:hypothetical protein BS78_04G295400 [Paspalum vaginatum]|nr:hypothetical protein BS78_04G295400 [Paspalum vaginatum]
MAALLVLAPLLTAPHLSLLFSPGLSLMLRFVMNARILSGAICTKEARFGKRVFSWRSGTLLELHATARGVRQSRMRGPATRRQRCRVDPDYVASCVAGRARRHVLRRVATSGCCQQGPSSILFFFCRKRKSYWLWIAGCRREYLCGFF